MTATAPSQTSPSLGWFATERALASTMLPADRRRAFRLGVLVVVGGLLEAIGVGMVVPVLALLSNPDWIQTVPWVADRLPARLIQDERALATAALTLLVAATLLRTLFTLALAHEQLSFVRDFEVSTSTRLLDSYLRRPWTFHLRRNSAELVRNVRHEASTVGFVFSAVLGVFTDTAILVSIVAVLIAMEPLPSLAVGAILVAVGGGYQLLMRGRIERWGAARMKFEGLRIQHLQQGLAAVRELRLANATSQLVSQYEGDTRSQLATVQRHTFASYLPRMLFDLVAVIALAATILLLLALGRSPAEIVPAVGLYAVAATRLLPGANRLVGSLQLIRWGAPSVGVVAAELGSAPTSGPERPVAGATVPGDIEMRDICFRYEGAERDALSRASIRIPLGSMVGVIGTSGSGKSTLLDVLLGLLEPSSGVVSCGGDDIRRDLRAWHRSVGYVPQNIFLFDDSLRRNIALGMPDAAIDDAALQRAIDAANLRELVDSWPAGVNTVVGERGARLSGGQRQRIGIARALYRNPAVLVLDEATSALDTETEDAVMRSITDLRGDRTIVIVAHRLSTVSRCDWIYRLDSGRVVQQGAAAEVLGSPPR